VRLRTTAATCFEKVDAATAIIWKMRQIAETAFQRLNAPELLPTGYAGAQDVDGIQHTAVNHQEVAA
jgi:putative transposase